MHLVLDRRVSLWRTEGKLTVGVHLCRPQLLYSVDCVISIIANNDLPCRFLRQHPNSISSNQVAVNIVTQTGDCSVEVLAGLAGLEDTPRPGGPKTVLTEQVIGEILAATVTPPPEALQAAGVTHWSSRRLADWLRRNKKIRVSHDSDRLPLTSISASTKNMDRTRDRPIRLSGTQGDPQNQREQMQEDILQVVHAIKP